MLDFIEFFKNEEMYKRPVTLKSDCFKAGDKFVFKTDKKSGAVYHSDKKGRAIYRKGTDYSVKSRKNADGATLYYILKSGYFTGYYFELEDDVVKIRTKKIDDDEIQFLTEQVETDGRKDKRNKVIVAFVVILCLAVVCVYVFTGFGRISNLFASCTSYVQTIAEDGTYYLEKENGGIDDKSFIKLKGGNWESGEGMKGTYKVSYGNISFYMDNVVFMQGRIYDSLNRSVIEIEAFGAVATYVRQM